MSIELPNKVCNACKWCTTHDTYPERIEIDCAFHSELRFPKGSVPTCELWEEKDPTLAELRDEVRELKRELKLPRRDELEGVITKIEYVYPKCSCDCCKCKCRCSRYTRWPYYQPYSEPYNPPYIQPIWETTPYGGTNGTWSITTGDSSTCTMPTYQSRDSSGNWTKRGNVGTWTI